MSLDGARTRRGFLAAAAGGIAAMAAQALGRPIPAAAANGEAVTIGQAKLGTSPTALQVTQDSSAGIYGFGVTDKGLSQFPTSGTIAGHTKGTYNTALLGYAESGLTGVTGRSADGIAVFAYSSTGQGLYATGGSYAIIGDGRIKFSRSGLATIRAGQTSALLDLYGPVEFDTLVLLTPKVNIGSRSLYYVLDTATNDITIKMSSSRTKPTPVAWMVLN